MQSPREQTHIPFRAVPGAMPVAPRARARRAAIGRGASVLPVPVYVLASLLVAAASITTNAMLTAACIISFVMLAALLWRPGEPPVLFFACSVQWIQVAMKAFHADYYRLSVTQVSLGQRGDLAIWLGLTGILVLAAGMRLATFTKPLPLQALADEKLSRISIGRLFGIYLLATGVSAVLTRLSFQFLSVGQLLVGAAHLKWVFYWLLAYLVTRRRSHRGYLVVATMLEFLQGIGYFAEFKTVFFVLILALLTISWRLTPRSGLLAGLAATVLVLMGLLWTGIKDDFRVYLNRGTGQQLNLVSPSEELSTFVSMITAIRPAMLGEQAEAMAQRIEYTDFFAATLDRVPSQQPYERGTLLAASIAHVLMPRMFFPNKPMLGYDSEETGKYTGLSLAGAEQGTSISLGYMVEDYIDFGPIGMFVPIFALGILWGVMYSYLVKKAFVRPVGFAFATALFVYMGGFETTQPKLLGSMISNFLILAALLRFVMPATLRWLSVESPTVRRRPTPQHGGLQSI
jgi:hypothetical protein